MLKMRVGSFLVSMAALTTFWGCSSPDSPIGCDQNDMKKTATALGNSPQTLQVAAAGPGQLWALSNTLVTSNDYRIYKCSTATNTWTETSHFGTRITLSPSGNCYHLNSGNEIWFGKGTSGYNIPKPSDFVSMSDLSVCQQSSTYDQLWVLGTLSNGDKKIRLCYINTVYNTSSWDLNYVYYQPIDGYTPVKIRRDPSSTTYAIIIYANADSRILYATNNGGYTWNLQNITPSPADAAVWGTNVIFSYGNYSIPASYCIKGTMNGSYNLMLGIGQGQERTVAIDYNNGSLYTYTLTYDGLVEKNPF